MPANKVLQSETYYYFAGHHSDYQRIQPDHWLKSNGTQQKGQWK